MWGSLPESPFAFWALALLFALVDSAILLRPGEFTFRRHGNGRIELRVPRSPYLVRKQELVFTLFSYFLRPFHLSSVDAGATSNPEKMRALCRIEPIHRRLGAFAIVALALIVLVGPTLSILWGSGQAILYVALALYANSLAAVVYVLSRRSDLTMSRSDLSRLSFELLVCPPLVVNIAKRLTMRRNLVLETRELLRDQPEMLGRIAASLELFDHPAAAR